MGFNERNKLAPELLRLTESSRYRTYEVQLPNGSVGRVRTNLFPEDLERYFPDPIERQAYMLMLARISPLWNVEKKPE